MPPLLFMLLCAQRNQELNFVFKKISYKGQLINKLICAHDDAINESPSPQANEMEYRHSLGSYKQQQHQSPSLTFGCRSSAMELKGDQILNDAPSSRSSSHWGATLWLMFCCGGSPECHIIVATLL